MVFIWVRLPEKLCVFYLLLNALVSYRCRSLPPFRVLSKALSFFAYLYVTLSVVFAAN